MSPSEPKQPGTTESDHLVIAGRIADLDAAVNARDRAKAIEVLDQAGLTDRVSLMVDTIFANPADYGYPPSPIASEAGDEDEEGEDWEEDEPTRVQFTLTVISDYPIDELRHLLQQAIRPRQPDHAFMYKLHHFSLADDDWQTRADAVDAGVLEALDALDATDVALERVTPPNAWVRAHFTFTPGAETITATAVKRLAAYEAVPWIDVLGG
jgi:hypothetical protein